MKTQRLIRGAIVGAALVAVGLATSTPVVAAADQKPNELTLAMQRDLGLTEEQAEDWIAAQDAALRLEAELTPQLGRDLVGAWFDGPSGRLVVTVTSAERAEQARAAGAEARVVPHSAEELETIKAGLDQRTRTDPAAVDGVVSYRVDPQTDAVIVTVHSGRPRPPVLDELTRHGDAVRIEQTDVQPTVAALPLRGGDLYVAGNLGCSIGFNAYAGAFRYFLTAGHCGPVGTQASANGTWIGPFTHSIFPTRDEAAVRVDNIFAWSSGPWIRTYNLANPNEVYTVNGLRSSVIGTNMCKSGVTTKFTCGVIKGKGESAAYDHDLNPATPPVWVFNLVRHSACVEQGDSGGSNFSWNAFNQNFAEGITSGASMMKDGSGKLRCLSVFGQQNISYYQMASEALTQFGLNLWTA